MKATHTPSKNLGRKLIGDAKLTSAERQRRYREKLRQTGAKDFLLTLPEMYREHIDALASAGETTPSAALRLLVENALIRYVGIMNRVNRMKENGATDEEEAVFIHTHMRPALPPMEPLRGNP